MVRDGAGVGARGHGRAAAAGRGGRVVAAVPARVRAAEPARLADPRHAERSPPTRRTVDLLFFPTGGGKTEAYLGLDRVHVRDPPAAGRRRLGRRSTARGVAVLMRYTLRLLTSQQFQRAAALVCAAEVQRTAPISDVMAGSSTSVSGWAARSPGNWPCLCTSSLRVFAR